MDGSTSSASPVRPDVGILGSYQTEPIRISRTTVSAERGLGNQEVVGEDPLSAGVGLLSLAGSQEMRFLGSSSGVTWAKLISS